MSNPDAQRFTALIEPHIDVVFRAAYRLTRNRADADDLVQDTCVRAFLNIGQLSEARQVKAWLLRVLHNLFVDGVRRARLGPVAREHDGEERNELCENPEPTPETSADRSQREELLQRAWLRLDRGHRALLALKAEGYSLAEIGEITGLATEALTARLYRARQSFARHLAAEQGLSLTTEMEIAK